MFQPHHHMDNRCSFFLKMGACRHGDSCTKLHYRPPISPTVLFPMMYPNPLAVELITTRSFDFEFDKVYLKKHFEHFYKGVWRTFMEFGRIAELRVVGNLCEHLLGNVYIKFESEQSAAKVVEELKMKSYEGIPLLPEFSPVVDFTDACCKDDREGLCSRRAQCNFLHILKVSKSTMRKLEEEQNEYWKKREKKRERTRRSRSKRDSSRRSRSRHSRKRSRDHRKRTPEAPVDSRLCHICGKPGHISRDCPLKPSPI